jgi:TonB family protein
MSIQFCSALRNAQRTITVVVALAAAVCCASVRAFAFDTAHIYTEDQVKVVRRVTPTYPVIAKQMNVGGKVMVDLTLNDDGSVENAKTVLGSPVLAPAALMAGKGWKFEPVKAEADGSKPVVRITFNFALH